MKKSLAHLSKDKRRELKVIINRILKRLPETQMIILYGSYAWGNYVEYDQRVEFGVHTEYMSDFDLLVVTHGVHQDRTRNILNLCIIYVMASFNLHQTTENAFKAVRLVNTLYSGKLHNLKKLIRIVKKYSPDGYSSIFPCRIVEEKRLFTLLQAAYIEARYNAKFVVKKEDIDALRPPIERLLELTKRLCEERIKEYENMIDNP